MCLSLVIDVCCQVEVTASGLLLVRRSPAECVCVCLCVCVSLSVIMRNSNTLTYNEYVESDQTNKERKCFIPGRKCRQPHSLGHGRRCHIKIPS